MIVRRPGRGALSIFVLSTLIATCVAGSGLAVAAAPTTPPASYPNPVAISGSTGAHDPGAVKTPEGGYIVATTGNNIPLKTSSNRTSWSNAGSAFPSGMPWVSTFTGGSSTIWAPDLTYQDGTYYMYYAASTFGSQNSGIFLATSTTGASGSWVDRGLVISSSSSVNYNAIDPNLVIADGQWYLSFGSFWTGIKQIDIDPATGLRSGTAIRGIAQRSGSTAIEAPFVFHHGDFYYLWVSFDTCCQGASSTYRIMVGRSASPTGPFVDRNGTAMTAGGGTEVLAGHGDVHGPGGQSVIADTDGDVLVYHYYAGAAGIATLGINPIGYDAEAWPFVY
jgi:arabinan endo-1,5-alpha-L-arabinosidase